METLIIRRLGCLDYQEALNIQMETRASVTAGRIPHTLLLTEHKPVITLGRRGEMAGIQKADTLEREGINVLNTNRGGNVTYHGPGQLVAYPIIDLRTLNLDIHRYVLGLESVTIRLLQRFSIEGWRSKNNYGVFTKKGKIASLGIHIARWVTMHGIAINVDPDMAHWACISPCGSLGVRAASIASFQSPPPDLSYVADVFSREFLAEFSLRTTN